MPRTECLLQGERCQCSVCKECFSTTRNFDLHRKGAHGVDRHCVDPESVGLVIGETAKGTFWKMPMTEDPAIIMERINKSKAKQEG